MKVTQWRPFCFCHFEGLRVTGQLDRHQKWIQHTQIMLKKWSVNFSPKMPLEVTFCQNGTSLHPDLSLSDWLARKLILGEQRVNPLLHNPPQTALSPQSRRDLTVTSQ